MPKHDELVEANWIDFKSMRLDAMLRAQNDPLRVEIRHEQWAHFGLTVYNNMHNGRFHLAMRKALDAADEEHATVDPLDTLVRRISIFLLTGTIA